MINVLISRCLMGENCRYDGKANTIESLEKIKSECNLIPVCPEISAGLSTPRQPSEIKDGRVYMKDGKDVTQHFLKGAYNALETARKYGCKAALLKSKSPSCGNKTIYDGSFTGKLTEGDGVTAKLLKEHSIAVFTENEIPLFFEFLEECK